MDVLPWEYPTLLEYSRKALCEYVNVGLLVCLVGEMQSKALTWNCAMQAPPLERRGLPAVRVQRAMAGHTTYLEQR